MVRCGVPKVLLPNGNGRDALHTRNAKQEDCVSERMLRVVCFAPVMGQELPPRTLHGGLSSGLPLGRLVVRSPSVLVVHPSGDCRLLLQPLLQVGGGQLAVIPVFHRG